MNFVQFVNDLSDPPIKEALAGKILAKKVTDSWLTWLI